MALMHKDGLAGTHGTEGHRASAGSLAAHWQLSCWRCIRCPGHCLWPDFYDWRFYLEFVDIKKQLRHEQAHCVVAAGQIS